MLHLSCYDKYCTCPAGLLGCCNHITVTLYCLEDFVRRGLREERKIVQKSYRHGTSLGNILDQRPTDDVVCTWKKRNVPRHIMSTSGTRGIVDPNKARRLREDLSEIENNKLYFDRLCHLHF